MRALATEVMCCISVSNMVFLCFGVTVEPADGDSQRIKFKVRE